MGWTWREVAFQQSSWADVRYELWASTQMAGTDHSFSRMCKGLMCFRWRGQETVLCTTWMIQIFSVISTRTRNITMVLMSESIVRWTDVCDVLFQCLKSQDLYNQGFLFPPINDSKRFLKTRSPWFHIKTTLVYAHSRVWDHQNVSSFRFPVVPGACLSHHKQQFQGCGRAPGWSFSSAGLHPASYSQKI